MVVGMVSAEAWGQADTSGPGTWYTEVQTTSHWQAALHLCLMLGIARCALQHKASG